VKFVWITGTMTKVWMSPRIRNYPVQRAAKKDLIADNSKQA
jgi:hypothetical protein